MSSLSDLDNFDFTIVDATTEPYGDVKYADPGYQEDGVKRYPIDTEAHIRAAWAYINMPKNAEQYTPDDLKRVRERIITAMRAIGADVKVSAAEYIDADTTSSIDNMVDVDGGVVVDSVHDAISDNDGMSSLMISPVNYVECKGVITVEGIRSGDGKLFNAGALYWDKPPLPLMWEKETSHGGDHNVSVRVGTIREIWREPSPDGRTDVNMIMANGIIDLGSVDGREVFRRMRDGFLHGNSVDVDSVDDASVELRYSASTGVRDVYAMMNTPMRPELTIYHKGRIRATTLVEIPSFTEAHLALVDVLSSTVPMADVSSICAAMTELVAASTIIEITDAPPREWFNEPKDVTPLGALTVTNNGRVYGYVAPRDTRHRSFPGREQYVPMGNVDYSRFMSGETIVADGGRVVTGRITMNCGHASTTHPLTASRAAEHYDNSCSIAANVRVGENKHGVWVAGALLSDLTSATIQRIMSCSLSGDWRASLDKPGQREFVAALLVPVPGFPMARKAPSVEYANGQLVASSVPVLFDDGTMRFGKDGLTVDGANENAVTRQRKVSVLRLRTSVARSRRG